MGIPFRYTLTPFFNLLWLVSLPSSLDTPQDILVFPYTFPHYESLIMDGMLYFPHAL